MAENDAIDEREVELRMELLRARYGERFAEPEQEEEVRKRVADELIRVAAALKAAPIAPGEEPFPPFVPYRSDDR